MAERTKKQIAAAITTALGVPPVRFSRGSSEPKRLFVEIVRVLNLGIDTSRRNTKPRVGEAIVRAAGGDWDNSCESGGDTVTRIGLLRLEDATLQLLGSPTPIALPVRKSAPVIAVVAPGEHGLEPVPVISKAEARIAEQIEARLVKDFREWLDPAGTRLRGISITTGDGARLRVDLFDTSTGTLVEAKAKPTRNYLRLAVGQLLDYRRYLPQVKSLSVLLPRRPVADLLEFLASVGVSAIWKSGDVFSETEEGAVTK